MPDAGSLDAIRNLRRNDMHTLTLSKCHDSPFYTRTRKNGEYLRLCSACQKPSETYSYPFETVKQMCDWINSRPVWAYTASTTLDRPKKSCLRSNAPFLLGLTGLVLVGVLIAFAAR